MKLIRMSHLLLHSSKISLLVNFHTFTVSYIFSRVICSSLHIPGTSVLQCIMSLLDLCVKYV